MTRMVTRRDMWMVMNGIIDPRNTAKTHGTNAEDTMTQAGPDLTQLRGEKTGTAQMDLQGRMRIDLRTVNGEGHRAVRVGAGGALKERVNMTQGIVMKRTPPFPPGTTTPTKGYHNMGDIDTPSAICSQETAYPVSLKTKY